MATELVAQLRDAAVAGPGDVTPDMLRRAADEIERLRRGEFVCKQCGLRKNGEKPNVDF